MTPHPHAYPARHAHGELDTLVVGAAITGAFRPSPTPLAPVPPLPTRQLVVTRREHCSRCGSSHDVYAIIDDLPPDSRPGPVIVVRSRS